MENTQKNLAKRHAKRHNIIEPISATFLQKEKDKIR
jgi:hypothetical protein